MLFYLTYLCEVRLHVLVLWLIYFVGEVDEELRVALDGEALHPEGHRVLEASDEAFVLCDVVGDLLALLEADVTPTMRLYLPHEGARLRGITAW